MECTAKHRDKLTQDTPEDDDDVVQFEPCLEARVVMWRLAQMEKEGTDRVETAAATVRSLGETKQKMGW